jgi:hypothetical protein
VSPAGHVTPLQVHMPFVQVGADDGHTMQVPWVPHWLLEPPGTQREGVAVEQQPAQEVGSQTHCAPAPVPMHTSPVLHGGPLPHWHWPAALQRFALGAVHERHAAPITPQVLTDDGVLQALFAQQPLRQELEVHLHTPCTHCWPWAHGAFVPHWQPPAAQLSERRSHAAHMAPF